MSLSQIQLVWVRIRLEWECFEWIWEMITKMTESKMAVSEFKLAEFQDGCHHQVDLEWMREVFLCANGGNQSWQVWVSLRVNTKIAGSKMAEFNMAEFKMATIIKLRSEWMSLSQIELVWVRGRLEWECFEWIWEMITRSPESKMCSDWIQHGRISKWLPSSSWVRLNEWSFYVQNGWIQVGRIQDGCHHQVEVRMKWVWVILN